MEDLGHVVLPGRDGEPNGSPVRIIQLTDLHHFPEDCHEFDCQAAKGRVVPIGVGTPYSTTRDLRVIEAILRRVRPHLVVLTGDILDGRPHGPSGDPEGWRRSLLEVLRPVCAAGCAWTFTPGNHDDDGGPWSRRDLLGAYALGEDAPGCVSAGARSFDHTLTVGVGDAAPAARVRLWIFDSGGNHPDPKIRYHTFSPNAVDAHRRLAQSLPQMGCDLAFFHIPLPQVNGLRPIAGNNNLFQSALNAGKVPFPFNREPFTSLLRLAGKDLVAGSSTLESGMFDAMAKAGKVWACFFGHDHASDGVFASPLGGPLLVYGRTGATTPPVDWEGDAGPLPFKVGARAIEWRPSNADSRTNATGTLRTWIELEDEIEAASEVDLRRHDRSGSPSWRSCSCLA